MAVLVRFMKQDLSVMKAGVVSFQIAPAVLKYMAYKGHNEYFCEHSQLSCIFLKVESAHKNIQRLVMTKIYVKPLNVCFFHVYFLFRSLGFKRNHFEWKFKINREFYPFCIVFF